MESVDAEPRGAQFRRVATAVVTIVGLDQITKSLAVGHLTRGQEVRLVGRLLMLDLTSNSGGSFSSFQGSTPLLAVGATVASVYLVHLIRGTRDRLTVGALTLLLAGAIGNLTDRVFRAPSFLHGEVIDFIRLPRWPTFNVADMAVTFGGVALAVSALRPDKREPSPDASGATGETP